MGDLPSLLFSNVCYRFFFSASLPMVSFINHFPPLGLTWEECKAQCPQGVVPACHNAEDTVTISGPQVHALKIMMNIYKTYSVYRITVCILESRT